MTKEKQKTKENFLKKYESWNTAVLLVVVNSIDFVFAVIICNIFLKLIRTQ